VGPLSCEPRTSRSVNIHTSPPGYLTAIPFFGIVFTRFVLDSTPISVALTPVGFVPAIHLSPILLHRYVAHLYKETHTQPLMTRTVFLQNEHYWRRVRVRDPHRLISGCQIVEDDNSRFKAAHIYPRGYDVDVSPFGLILTMNIQWVSKAYHRSRTLPELGGATKIDAIQNVIYMMRGISTNLLSIFICPLSVLIGMCSPQAGYAVIPFVPSYGDIAGNIADSNLRLLHELLHRLFIQSVLANMKGPGEPTEDTLGTGMMNLSRQDLSGGKEGQAHLEFEMAHRLHNLRVAQESGS
jgi:hypothetical protein